MQIDINIIKNVLYHINILLLCICLCQSIQLFILSSQIEN